jgi:type IV secretion system protein TrbL
MWNSSGNRLNKKPKTLSLITLLCLILLGVLLFYSIPSEGAEFGTTSAFTQGMLDKFRTNFLSFEESIHKAALALFGALFLCQFTWSVLQLFLTESLTFASVISTVIRQIMTGMFFYWLLFDRSILKGIVDSFSQLASSGLTFSDLLYFCETATRNLMTAVQSKGGLSIEGISLFFSGLAASLVMSYALMTAIGYMAIVLLENYIVSSLGLILLGFGGSEYTRNYALSYIRTLVHIGFKLFLVTIIIFVGADSFAKTTAGMVGNEAGSLIETCMMLIGQSFLFVAIIKIIPQIADTLISGVSMNTGAAGAAARGGATAAAGLAVGAASVMYNAPGKTADVIGGGISAVKSVASAYSAKFNAYKDKGLGSFRAGVSALGSTIWSGYQASRGKGETFNSSNSPNSMNASNTTSGGSNKSETPAAANTSSPAPETQTAETGTSTSGASSEPVTIENSNSPDVPQTGSTDTAKSTAAKTDSSKTGSPNSSKNRAPKAPTPEELSKRIKKNLNRW